MILIADRIKELLVPTQRPEELRSDFVFRFEVVGERVGISNAGHLEARLVKLRPELEMMPCEGDILSQNDLAIVANPAARRKPGRSLGEQIGTGARGEAEIPHFVRAKTQARVEGGMRETNLG